MSHSRSYNCSQIPWELAALILCCNMPGTGPTPISSKFGLGSVWTKRAICRKFQRERLEEGGRPCRLKLMNLSSSQAAAKLCNARGAPFQLSFRSHARRITNSQCFSLRNFCFQEGKSRLAAPPGISLPRSAFTACRWSWWCVQNCKAAALF